MSSSTSSSSSTNGIWNRSVVVIDAFLGGGSQGRVYSGAFASDPSGAAKVAVKVGSISKTELRISRAMSTAGVGVPVVASKDLAVLTRAEDADLTRALRGSDSSLAQRYIQQAVEERPDAIVMMCMDEDLYSVARGVPDLATVARLARSLVTKVAKCHALGVVHRDIKPENVLVNRQRSNAYLSDWGSARDSDPDSDVEYYVTPGFLAPEVHEDPAAAGPASDWWAVGATVAELVYPVQLFASSTHEEHSMWLLAYAEVARSSKTGDPWSEAGLFYTEDDRAMRLRLIMNRIVSACALGGDDGAFVQDVLSRCLVWRPTARAEACRRAAWYNAYVKRTD